MRTHLWFPLRSAFLFSSAPDHPTSAIDVAHFPFALSFGQLRQALWKCAAESNHRQAGPKKTGVSELGLYRHLPRLIDVTPCSARLHGRKSLLKHSRILEARYNHSPAFRVHITP